MPVHLLSGASTLQSGPTPIAFREKASNPAGFLAWATSAVTTTTTENKSPLSKDSFLQPHSDDQTPRGSRGLARRSKTPLTSKPTTQMTAWP